MDEDWGKPKRKQVLPARDAYEVTRVLERNIEAGTGTGAAIGRPAAGKTGTTENHGDAWFAGYTPQLATVVWVGYPGRTAPMTSVHGIRVTGGTFPATIWQRFMAPALEPLPAADWSVPAGTIAWKRWCGRYQFAESAADAKVRNGCPRKKPKPKQTTPVRAGQPTTTDEPTETFAAPQPPPPPTTAPPPPPPPGPAPAQPTRGLIGEFGTVTRAITLEQDGEVEVRGSLYPARSFDGSPLRRGDEIEVVDLQDGVLLVAPPADAGFSEDDAAP